MSIVPSDSSHRNVFLILLICGLTLRLLAVVFFHPPLISDDIDYQALAQSLAAGSGFELEGKPTAYRMPGYPLILAATYVLFGDSNLCMKLLQVLADITSCFLIFAIGKKMFSEGVGLLALGIAAFFPIQILYVSHVMTETIFTTVLLFIVWRVLNEQNGGWIWNALVLGAVIGIAILIRTTAVVLLPVIYLYRHSSKTRWVPNLREFALMTGMALIVVSPWIVRNYVEFHRVALTSNSGVNFWMGNHSGASGSYSFPTVENPLRSVQDDFERSDLGFALGLEFITSHSSEFAILLGKKFAHFFAADYWLMTTIEYKPVWRSYPNAATVFAELSGWNIAIIHLPFMATLLLGLFGLIFHKGDDSRALFLFAGLILLWLFVHLFFYAGARYRFPIVPLFILTSAFGFHLIRTKTFLLSKLRLTTFVCLAGLFISGWAAELWTIQSKKMSVELLREHLKRPPPETKEIPLR